MRRSSLTSAKGLKPGGLALGDAEEMDRVRQQRGRRILVGRREDRRRRAPRRARPWTPCPGRPPRSRVLPSEYSFARSAKAAPALIFTRISSICATACWRASASPGENWRTISATCADVGNRVELLLPALVLERAGRRRTGPAATSTSRPMTFCSVIVWRIWRCRSSRVMPGLGERRVELGVGRQVVLRLDALDGRLDLLVGGARRAISLARSSRSFSWIMSSRTCVRSCVRSPRAPLAALSATASRLSYSDCVMSRSLTRATMLLDELGGRAGRGRRQEKPPGARTRFMRLS